jgi:16S rRNA (guanine966-N2)-methyltransferase
MKRGVRELRIVGGSLRGRKWTFPDIPGLRPTPDRVRETLFNWLAPHISGARVLDLFAGSGALGFEALSRGAATATFVDADRVASDQLRATAERFGLRQAQIECAVAEDFLQRQSPAAFELIFLDPPFAADQLAPVLQQLGTRGILAPAGYCYVETAADAGLPPLPEGWIIHRHGRAGEVGYHLLHEPTRHLPRNV